VKVALFLILVLVEVGLGAVLLFPFQYLGVNFSFKNMLFHGYISILAAKVLIINELRKYFFVFFYHSRIFIYVFFLLSPFFCTAI